MVGVWVGLGVSVGWSEAVLLAVGADVELGTAVGVAVGRTVGGTGVDVGVDAHASSASAVPLNASNRKNSRRDNRLRFGIVSFSHGICSLRLTSRVSRNTTATNTAPISKTTVLR